MTLAQELDARSGSGCELCGSNEALDVYTIIENTPSLENSLWCCQNCTAQINKDKQIDVNHWRCLNDSMWSELPPVKAISWHMLQHLSGESWPQDLLDIFYLDEETVKLTKEMPLIALAQEVLQHKDSNGVVLQTGDTVVLTKDLNVKGASLVAKRGAAVRGISLVRDNHEHIEGKVAGQQIVILTKFVKKSK